MRSTVTGIAISLLVVALGCGGGGGMNSGTNAPILISLQITAPSSNVTVGQTLQVTAMGTYSDHSSKDVTQSVSWSSSNTAVATVSNTGMLTAQSSGSVSVSALSGSVTAALSVTIAPKLISIALSPGAATIAQQTIEQFIATGTYSDNSTQNITSSVSWSSSNTGVAAVSSSVPTSGLTKGLSPGAVTITASSGSVSSTASLTVTSATPVSITVAPVNSSLPLDVSQQFAATATFSDSTQQDVTGVAAWTSQSPSIASVTTSGLVSAKNLGSTNISATFEAVTVSTSVTVNATDLSSISIQPANASIAQGTKAQLAAIGTFNDGSTHNITSQVAWSSSNSAVAQFISGSQVQGLTPGSAMITATLGTVTASENLTVTNATIQTVTVTPIGPTIPAGAHQSFAATGVFSDSSSQDITISTQWASSNTAVATVGSQGSSFGVSTGVGAGTTIISASFSYAGASATGTTSLNVNSATLLSISVTSNNGLLAPGAGVQFNAKGTWSDGTTQNVNQSVTWSSSDSQVASVSSSGFVTGQSAGTATITAQSGALSASASVVVEGSVLTSIQIAPQSASVPETIQFPFTATGTFADGNTLNLTAAANWTSSTSSVATISNALGNPGVATGVAPGSTSISAAFDGLSGTATLTVTNATLTSITVLPANPSIALGASQQFKANGTFSDGSVLNITGQVAWSSSSVTVATINFAGVASSASQGTTTVRATLNGVSGETVLTVQ